MIDRVFIRGVGVNRTAQFLDGHGKFTRPSRRCALENHMFNKMGDSRLIRPFINTTGLDPQLHGRHFSARGLLNQNGCSVFKDFFIKIR